MQRHSLEPAYYTHGRLLVGGALVFCSAVIVQLVQLPPPQLTTDLKLALWGAAVAISPLAGLLSIYVSHERVKVRHRTHYVRGLEFVGSRATFACVAAIFQHFSGAVALVFFAVSVIVVWCIMRDSKYHDKINTLTEDPVSMEEQHDRDFWSDALFVLLVAVILLGGWLLVRFLAQRYL